MATSWTNPIGVGSLVRAFDITELRNAINADRAAASPPLPPYAWTDDPLTTSTPIKALHMTEMRTAIQELWNTKSMGTIPNWSTGIVPGAGSRVYASDPNDLRRWLNQYEEHGSVNGPKRGIHLRDGGDLRQCDLDALNAFKPGLVVVLSCDVDPSSRPDMFNYLKSIQTSAEIFVRYWPTPGPQYIPPPDPPKRSIVDPSWAYDWEYNYPKGVPKDPWDVAYEIVTKAENWKAQGLINFRYFTGNEPEIEWDGPLPPEGPGRNPQWWTGFWEDVDHYYRDIYYAIEHPEEDPLKRPRGGRPVEMYPPALMQYASVGVSNYLKDGTVRCHTVSPTGGTEVDDCSTYQWQFGERGLDLVKTMLEYHSNGTAVGRVLFHNYFWPGYQAQQAIFNFLPGWLKDNIKLYGWPNRVTEFGWIPDAVKTGECPSPTYCCPADLDTTTTSCDGARTGISSWGDYNDYVRLSGQLDGYAVWLLSDATNKVPYFVAVREDGSRRPWFDRLIEFYNVK